MYFCEFCVVRAVKLPVKFMKRKKPGKTAPGPSGELVDGPAFPFSFGPRRFVSKGPRRLFVPQKCLSSPAFEVEVERPRALLRLPIHGG